MFCNPIFLILLVNVLGLVWAVRSWRKTVQEKWMNNLRDAAAEVIGSAELIYGLDSSAVEAQLPSAKSAFIASEQKLLLLFRENSSRHKTFKSQAEKLRASAENREVREYRNCVDQFASLASERLLEEWEVISKWY